MTRTIESTPRKDKYRMPGEFEPHAGCWMLWPDRPELWRYGGKYAQWAYAKVAAAIARFEPVTVGVRQEQFLHARYLLPDHVRLVEMSYRGAWIRDNGPTFVKNDEGEVRGVDWNFNAWGELYKSWEQDDLVARKVLEIERVDRYKANFILEGGSIHVDGEGTLLTTQECLLNPNRNPKLSQEEIELLLKKYLNLEKIIWLDKGVYLDETSGHVDNLCCFIRPGVVALTWTADRSDPQYDISCAAYEILMRATDARGRKFEIHKIHQPGPLFITKEECAGIDIQDGERIWQPGERLPASYINFYIANGGIIAPTFDDLHDSEALKTLQMLFPDREVVGIPGREILLGGGNVHCITQQQPSP